MEKFEFFHPSNKEQNLLEAQGQDKDDKINKKESFHSGIHFQEQELSQQTLSQLQKTDYETFLQKSQQLQKTSYPSAFDFLQVLREPVIKKNQLLKIEHLNFPILECTKKQLIQCSKKMMKNNSFSQNFINENILQKVLVKIALGYNQVAYHNFSHAFSLIQLLSICLNSDSSLKELYSEEEIFFAFLAGLGHDINHSGTNNSFQIKMKSNFACIAENDAVLQKMHIRYLFEILKKDPSLNLLQRSKSPKKMKQLMTRLILATDIARHFSNLKTFSEKIKKKSFNFSLDEDRYFNLQQLFHACDIGNPCLQFQQYLNWSSLLSYEFNEQTKLQEENNLEVTEMLRYKDKKQFLKGQLGFINGLVMPQWKQLSCMWDGLKVFFAGINTNIQELENRCQEEQQ